MKPTENLTGITIKGDYHDFYDLVDSIYRITTEEEDIIDPYYGVKLMLLGLCYDIRHASMGDREVELIKNGMNEEKMEWLKIDTPTKNVYYSVNVLFPHAIFLATAVPELYYEAYKFYGTEAKRKGIVGDLPSFKFSQYKRDVANLDVLCAGIWEALGEAIGEDELKKIIRLKELEVENFEDNMIHYIDKCNIELIKTEPEKRKTKLKNIAKRIVKRPRTYYSLEEDLFEASRLYNASVYDLRNPEHDLPENWEW